MLEDKDSLLVSHDKWGAREVSKTELGLHIVVFWSWALPLWGALWLLSRPFHYIGLGAESVFQRWKQKKMVKK